MRVAFVMWFDAVWRIVMCVVLFRMIENGSEWCGM